MLRVLHLIETLGRGGAERLLATILPALREYEIEPLVAVMHEPFDLKPVLESSGIRVIELPRFHKWNIPKAVRILRKLQRDERIDIIHAHLYFPGLYAGLLGASSDLPVFESFHNLAYAGANRNGIKLKLRKNLRKIVAKQSGAHFIGVSQAVADHYTEALSLLRVEVLHNAIDLNTIDAALGKLAAEKGQAEKLKLVVPGRLVSEKGHADLLKALSLTEFPAFDLHFLGGGPLKNSLCMAAAQLGISVSISDTIAHDRFLEQVAGSDICIVPSRYEGFGITAAEAMALGVPVIASDAGGLPEVVGDAGLTFPAGNVQALGHAVRHLSQDARLRGQLALAGKQRARGMFAVENVSAKLAELYRRAV